MSNPWDQIGDIPGISPANQSAAKKIFYNTMQVRADNLKKLATMVKTKKELSNIPLEGQGKECLITDLNKYINDLKNDYKSKYVTDETEKNYVDLTKLIKSASTAIKKIDSDLDSMNADINFSLDQPFNIIEKEMSQHMINNVGNHIAPANKSRRAGWIDLQRAYNKLLCVEIKSLQEGAKVK